MENCMHMNSRSYFKAKNTDFIVYTCECVLELCHCMAYVLLNMAVSRYD